jgi:hypothetical protein
MCSLYLGAITGTKVIIKIFQPNKVQNKIYISFCADNLSQNKYVRYTNNSRPPGEQQRTTRGLSPQFDNLWITVHIVVYYEVLSFLRRSIVWRTEETTVSITVCDGTWGLWNSKWQLANASFIEQ